MSKPRSKRSPFLDKIKRTDCKVEVLYFVTPKGRCPAEDDFLNDHKKVTKGKKAQLTAILLRYAVEGEILNDQRCHRLKGKVRDFWEIKAHQHRLFFFKEGTDRIIITHGFVKQDDELDPEEEDRMISIRDTYNNSTLYKYKD